MGNAIAWGLLFLAVLALVVGLVLFAFAGWANVVADQCRAAGGFIFWVDGDGVNHDRYRMGMLPWRSTCYGSME